MKIEIAEPGRMTQSGSSLLRLIQNNKTPVLDLFVRESAQNSLDAHNPETKSRYVSLEYITGEFNSKKLADELEGISAPLYDRFPSEHSQYIAVRDSNTYGLTGPMDVNEVAEDNNYGNLLKLVYEICKPQEAEGAGGSWGLGKTIYFRIGIGLVIYYSRICNEDGCYSSRLAASFVENETAPDAFIPRYKGMAKRGIAWWGKQNKENSTVPVTDEVYIENFLGIFGMAPYTGTETGTTIIIPYIDRESLLSNNRMDYSDEIGEHFEPYWYSSLESYLRISIQRWYAPRLSNNKYPYGAFLRASINGDGIAASDMEPVFKVVQSLYNHANHVVGENDYITEIKADPTVKTTVIKKYLDGTTAGVVACVKLPRKDLEMEAPYNKPEPSVYFNCEITERNVNRPTVFFTRRPGMIVSYENVSAWTAGTPSTNKNEYILCIFVLNSQIKTKGNNPPVSTIEEYIRKSEMADHTSWNDWGSADYNPRFVSKIQKSVVKTLSDRYFVAEQEHETKENSELGKFLGDLILPPDGFGKGASPPGKAGGSGSSKSRTRKKMSFAVIYPEITYYSNKMIVPMELKTSSNKKIKHAAFEMQIDSEAKKISIHEWEDKMNLYSPFDIEKLELYINVLDGEKLKHSLTLDKDMPSSSFGDINFLLRITEKGTVYGMDIASEMEHSMNVRISAVVRLDKKDVRPLFVYEKEVG